MQRLLETVNRVKVKGLDARLSGTQSASRRSFASPRSSLESGTSRSSAVPPSTSSIAACHGCRSTPN